MTTRLGLTPPIEVTGFRRAVELCARAEQLGYTDVWSAEVGATDAFSPLAAIAVKTDRVRLGTALVPVFTRPPALTAMSAAGLQQLSGGRFVLGVGTSSPAIIDLWMGLEFDGRVKRIEEYVEVLREALSGKKIDYEGETVRVEAFRLQGLDGFALVSLYGPVLDALGAALPLDQALILLKVNTEYVDALLLTQRPEVVAGHLRHAAPTGLVEAVGGSPHALRLLVEFGGRGGQSTCLVNGCGEGRPSVQIVWVDVLGTHQGIDGMSRQRVVAALPPRQANSRRAPAAPSGSSPRSRGVRPARQDLH